MSLMKRGAPRMPRDLIEELTLLEMSRLQRRCWEFALLLGAGLNPDEAEQIAEISQQADRAKMSQEAA